MSQALLAPAPVSPDNDALRELRNEVKKMNKTATRTNWIIVVLTVVLVMLTIVLVLQGFQLSARGN